MDLHEKLMRKTLELAKNGFIKIAPDPFRGALIAQGETIVGEGYLANRDAKDPEIHALKAAGEKAEGGTLYLNLEPAYGRHNGIDVLESIIAAKIARVMIAIKDPNPVVSGKSINELKMAGIEVETGILALEAEQLNEIYVKDVSTRRPFFNILSAMSLDGKVATRMQDNDKITGSETMEFVHQLRARYDAVMIGVDSILRDNPTLNCKALRGCDPWRIIIDSEAQTPLNSKVFLKSDPQEPRPPVLVVIGYGAHEERLQSMRHLGAEIIQCPNEDGSGSGVDMAKLMSLLNKRGITSVLLEGSGTLKASVLDAGIADKVTFVVAPKIIGGVEAKSPIGGEGVSFVYEALDVKRMSSRTLGGDLLIEGYLEN